MLESVNLFLFFTNNKLIFTSIFPIFVCSFITVISINLLCAKKSGGANNKNAGASQKAAAGSANTSKRSVKQVTNSPVTGITTPKTKSPDENGTPSADKIGGDEKGGKNADEKLSKEGGKKSEDSFETHKPVARDAKRAEEIKKVGHVDQRRKDYKTLRNDILSSDFDKSLGLPELEAKDKK